MNNSLNSSLDASTSNVLSPSSNLQADQKDKNKKSLIFKVISFCYLNYFKNFYY
jgi:hypothetical protein